MMCLHVLLVAPRSFKFMVNHVMPEVAGSYLICAPRSVPYCCLCGGVYDSQPDFNV